MSPGSPPRMRGKPQTDRYVFRRQGITPAGAGKTSPQFAPQGRTQGSPPQVRGKHLGGAPYSKSPRITPAGAGKTIRRYTVVHRSPGSPPQVRGKLPRIYPLSFQPRITPAGAGKTSLYHLFLSCQPDHPRRCGENSPLPLKVSINTGSPPQVRGKLFFAFAIDLYFRITPAGAGKTHVFPAKSRRWQDHPRRCGENKPSPMRSTARPGSPPQVRGKLLAVRLSPVLFRITPAGAGKTLKYILLCPKWWDHPRRCGENKDPELLLMYILGSPPQVRGKHGTMDAKTLDRGITPAGAGKTHLLDQFHFYLRDHPRRCGENLSAFTRKNRSGGSPPQVRGKHPHLGGFFCAHRITPAGAGKTCTYRKLAANYRDHPRRCGENVGFGEVCCRNQGSPPQVRGKRLMCGFCVPELGITPAGAGKTRHKADHDKRPEDHPRRCGENHIQRKLSVCKQGSPPQVRGKRGKHSLHACRVGITPAGAGKT